MSRDPERPRCDCPSCASTRRLLALCVPKISDRKVVAADIEALTQVEPVSSEPLHARIQVQLVAAELASTRLQPLDHSCTRPFGAMALGRYQIIDVDVFTPRQFGSHDKAGDTQHLTVGLNVRDLIPRLPLLFDLSDERFSIERRTELQQDSADPLEIVVRFSNPDVHRRLDTSGGI